MFGDGLKKRVLFAMFRVEFFGIAEIILVTNRGICLGLVS